MKEMITSLMAAFLLFTTCFSIVSCGGSHKFDYQLSKDGQYYIVTGIDVANGEEVLEIPSEYEGKPVKAISPLANAGYVLGAVDVEKSKLSKIVIPNSIRYIDGFARYAGRKLEVTFGDYTDKLVDGKVIPLFPEKGSSGSKTVDYSYTKDVLVNDFSIIFNIGAFGGTKSTLTFPDHTIFLSSDAVSGTGETLRFAGKLSTYSTDVNKTDFEDVSTTIVSVGLFKDVITPDVAVGSSYSIYLSLTDRTDMDNDVNIEKIVLNDAVSGLRLHALEIVLTNPMNTMKTPEIYYPAKIQDELDLVAFVNVNETVTTFLRRNNTEIKQYLYSETQPTDTEIKYWHFAANGEAVAW